MTELWLKGDPRLTRNRAGRTHSCVQWSGFQVKLRLATVDQPSESKSGIGLLQWARSRPLEVHPLRFAENRAGKTLEEHGGDA